ncbi:MAG: divalent-cation tolerance protein CutA, partial [Gammaproteobacteria bacterium]|nr:divalent-cation tolerance protein CutA [Gammaproteobacteria bacterium]
ELCVVMTTCSTQDAERLAMALVERRLASCVQRIGIDSTYRWEGAVQNDPETLLLIKTRRDRYDGAAPFLAEGHPYEEPEVLMLPVSNASDGHARWLADEAAPHAPSTVSRRTATSTE